MVTPGHIWSQVVTLITTKVRDLHNDGLDAFYGSMASNLELIKKSQKARNASLIDLLALLQVKIGTLLCLLSHHFFCSTHQYGKEGFREEKMQTQSKLTMLLRIEHRIA